MQTRLLFSDSKRNLELFMNNMKKKYKDIDNLRNEVQSLQCGSPDYVDDLMMWQTIINFERDSEALSKLESGEQMHLERKILFTEDILFFNTDFYSVLTPKRMDMLEYINNHRPKSLKNLAQEINRDYKNVYDDAKALEKFRLLDFIREGKNKRPVARITGIDVLFQK